MELKKSLPCLVVAIVALAAMPASADVLAAWNTWGDSPNSPNTVASGFTGSITGGGGNASFGSITGYYGDDISGAPTALSGLLVRPSTVQDDTLSLTITNNTGKAYNIEGFHFDFAPRDGGGSGDGYKSFVLKYASGGLGPADTTIDTQIDLPIIIVYNQSGDEGLYPGYDYALSNYLSDIVLNDGESATFTLQMSGATGGQTTSSVLDNFAITGSVPEPATMSLLAIGGLLTRYRRRK